jgi:hypothetical protein
MLYLEKYSSLTFDLRTTGTIGTYWNILLMLRWQATAAILIFLRDHTHLQIMLLLVISMTFQILILYGKPNINSLDNYMSLFNETMVSFYLYGLIMLSDF